MDTTSVVIAAINGWLQNVASTVTRPALQVAGWFLFNTPAFDALPDVRRLWAIGVGVADMAFILAALGAGVMVMSSGTFGTLYSAKRVLPRLVVAMVLTNASLPLCGFLIGLDNAIVTALLGPNPVADVWGQVIAQTATTDPTLGVLSSLLQLALAGMALMLALVEIGRYVVLVVGIVLAPLALAAYSLPQTDDVARLWGRVFGAALFVQVAQAELVNVGVQLLRNTNWLGAPTSTLVTALALVVVLYAVVRMPFWAYKWAWGQGISANRVVQTVIATASLFLEAI